MDEKTGNYWRILETNLDWIKYSDAKATAILTMYGIIITVALANVVNIIETLIISVPMLVLSILSGMLSVFAIFFGFRCISPRVVLPTYKSIMFFGSIVKHFNSMEAYQKYSSEILDTTVGLDDELARQIYVNAQIANAKFRDVSLSIRFFVLSIVPLIGTVILYIFRNL